MSRPPPSYRVPTHRAPNSVRADPQRLESASKRRWATGRTVKRALPGRQWEPVEVWTLKERGSDGRAVVVRTHAKRDAAVEWVSADD